MSIASALFYVYACEYCFCFVLCICLYVSLYVLLVGMCLLCFVCMLVSMCLLCFVCKFVSMCLLCFVCKFVCNFVYAVLRARGLLLGRVVL